MPKRKQNKKRTDMGRNSRKRVQRSVKDRLFRFLFEKDRGALLELYNALNGTDYRDPSRLEIVTIENAVYIVMKNDIAYILSGTLSMYEHQSTYSPNLPVRFLIYLAEEYQRVVDRAEKSLYGSGRISLPTPQCVVFYNGARKMPEEQILKLSDAFENKAARADVELTVRMLNINHGYNKILMGKCRVLEEYAMLVAKTRECMAGEKDMQAALSKAIDECIGEGILKEFLLKNRAEVLGMLLEEFDAEKYERTIRSEGWEKGLEQGREEGLEQGREEGLEQGREEGFRCSIGIMREANFPRDYAKRKLLENYGVSEEAVEQKLFMYWR